MRKFLMASIAALVMARYGDRGSWARIDGVTRRVAATGLSGPNTLTSWAIGTHLVIETRRPPNG